MNSFSQESPFLSVIKNIKVYPGGNSSRDRFIPIPGFRELLLKGDSELILLNTLSVISYGIQSSFQGLRTLVLGGEFMIGPTGVDTRIHSEDMWLNIDFRCCDLSEEEFKDAFSEFLNVVAKAVYGSIFYEGLDFSAVSKVSFSVSSTINLEESWYPPLQMKALGSFFGFVTRRWHDLSGIRSLRMSGREVGDIIQGLAFAVLGYNPDILSVRLKKKGIFLVLRNLSGQSENIVLFEIARKHGWKQSEIGTLKDLSEKIFMGLMRESRVADILRSNCSISRWVNKWNRLKDLILGRLSQKDYFVVTLARDCS